MGSSRARLFLVLCLSLAPYGIAQRPASKLPLDMDTQYIPIHTESRPCREDEWKFLALPSTAILLADYGYEIKPPLTCMAALAAWLPNAKTIRLSESLGLDDYREVTVLRGSPTSRTWVLPIEFGMAGFPHTEDNPHHLAAFNDLLRSASHKPDENILYELGNLYQFMVGIEEWFDSARTPKTISQAMRVNDVMGMIEHDARGITLRHREPDGDAWTHKYMIWEFSFTESEKGLRLRNVERRSLDEDSNDSRER